jgi:hypothetical protein
MKLNKKGIHKLQLKDSSMENEKNKQKGDELTMDSIKY